MMTRILIRLIVIVAALPQNVGAREPHVVAHRGLLRHAPENTLANFRACLELRLGFEFDVAMTLDGHLVCIHDDTVERTSDGTGEVAELTLDQIRRLDAGTWFDTKFAGEKIPTIDEVLKLVCEYRQHDLLIAVDLKAEGVEEQVVRLAEKHDVLHRMLFIGRTISEPEVRSALKRASAKAQTAVVTNNVKDFPMRWPLRTRIGCTFATCLRKNKWRPFEVRESEHSLPGQLSLGICQTTGSKPPIWD